MTSRTLVCIDGSDLSLSGAEAGLAVLAPGSPIVIVTVIEGPDPMMYTGTGIAGPVMSPEDYDRTREDTVAQADRALFDAALALNLSAADRQVLEGDPGPAICSYASEVSATAIVIGSRGRGGLKRAVLGSVSDYVVRNAPCAVVVTTPSAL